jgi:rubrerythrin
MVSENLESVMDVMRLMIDAEKTMSDLYQECAERFPGSEDLWKGLVHEELVHAEMLSRIMQTVKKRPEEFQIGNIASLPVVNSFIQGVKNDLQKLRVGQLDEDAAIFKAFHIESMFIEQKYTDAIATENEKYLNVLNQLRVETGDHKAKIAKRMKRHKSYQPQALTSEPQNMKTIPGS